MGDELIQPGIEGTYSVTVGDEHVPAHLRGTGVEVVSTPDLVRFMERAAIAAIEPYLPGDQTSVGTKVALKHMAGTPKGMSVEARVRLVERDRRRCVFDAEIFDEDEKVAEGTHERFIVPRDRKNEKLLAKIEKIRAKR